MTTTPKAKKAPLIVSPIGVAKYIYVHEPDRAFNDTDGTFKVDLVLKGRAAEEFSSKIDGFVEAAFAEHTSGMTPGEAKKWNRYRPYEAVEDDEGNPTGETLFRFKQNAVVRITKGDKAGTEREITITVKDANDEPTDTPVYSGSTVRVAFRPRPIVMATQKQVGVRLDFSVVQVAKFSKRDGVKLGKIAVDEGEGPGDEDTDEAY